MNNQNDNPPVKITKDPRCLAWARETLSMENKQAHRAILTAVQAAGVPGKEQGALRDATWKIRLHLLREEKSQRKATAREAREARVQPAELTGEAAEAAERLETIEANLRESFAAELGVAKPHPARPAGKVGFIDPTGQRKWGLQGIGALPGSWQKW